MNRNPVAPGSKPSECLFQAEGTARSWPRDGVEWGATRRSGDQRVGQEESGRSRGHRGRRRPWPPSLAGHRRKIGLCSCRALRYVGGVFLAAGPPDLQPSQRAFSSTRRPALRSPFLVPLATSRSAVFGQDPRAGLVGRGGGPLRLGQNADQLRREMQFVFKIRKNALGYYTKSV